MGETVLGRFTRTPRDDEPTALPSPPVCGSTGPLRERQNLGGLSALALNPGTARPEHLPSARSGANPMGCSGLPATIPICVRCRGRTEWDACRDSACPAPASGAVGDSPPSPPFATEGAARGSALSCRRRFSTRPGRTDLCPGTGLTSTPNLPGCVERSPSGGKPWDPWALRFYFSPASPACS